MVYSDLIFVLGLFPLSAIISFLDRSAEYKNMILILTSLLFFSWGKPFAVCIIFLSVFFDWGMGLLIEKYRDKKFSAVFAAGDMLVNLGIFLVFGHNYLFDSVEKLSFDSAVLPLGIGFYTLRGFSYVYDVYKGKISAEKNPFCLMTYMVSFHLMLAGPVVRYGDIEPEIRKRHINTDMINEGLSKMVVGLGKAVLLAGVFERIKLAGLNGNEITTLGCWLGMASFFAQYYFLFTGFADMGRGLGLINGFDYPENYRLIDPDKLFCGLLESFNVTVVAFFKELLGLDGERSKVYNFIAAVVCGVLIAMWYETKINFLIVGLAAGFLAALEKAVLEKYLSKLPVGFKYVYLIVVSMLIFGGLYFSSMYGYNKWLLGLVGVNTKYTLSVSVKYGVLKNITLIFIAFCAVCPFMKRIISSLEEKFVGDSTARYGVMRAVKTVCLALTLVTGVMTLAAQYI